MLREVTRFTPQVLSPPGWDERYVTVFGSSYDEVGVEGMESMKSKLRSAGMPVESLPGPPILTPGLSPLELTRRGRALAKAGVIGVREGPTQRDRRTLELLFDTISRDLSAARGVPTPTTLQWEFTDPDVPTWHLTIDNGSTAALEGAAAHPDVRLRVAYQDWTDIVGGRLDPLRAIATGRLRPRGTPAALARLRKIFPRR
jgi:SCP-2 sterol transfer family